MNVAEWIQPGMVEEMSLEVSAQQSAQHLGSGDLRVFATPMMIAAMEGNSHRLLAKHLPAGYSSVGVLVNVRHLAPTPLGSQVRVRSEVQAVEGLKVIFRVQAWDETEHIGEGQHERMVIDEARFLKRVASKSRAG